MSGYFQSLYLHVQRNQIRVVISRVDPRNTTLRWGALVLRRKYYIPLPNSLWHVDGHHALIRWRFVVHGSCGGKSRKVTFLKCSTNNLADTVLGLFKDAIKDNRGLWPLCIRVDHGVENVLLCEEMVTPWGRDGAVLLLAHPQVISDQKDPEDMSLDVFVIFFKFHFLRHGTVRMLKTCSSLKQHVHPY